MWIVVAVVGMVGGAPDSRAQGVSQETAAKAPLGDFVPARLIKRVEPRYPGIAAANQVDGDVVMKGTVAVDGTVKNIKVTHGLPQLVDAAVHAVSQWQYEPMRVNGVATPFEAVIVVHFHFAANAPSPTAPAPPPVEVPLPPAARAQLPPPPEGVMRISGRVMAANLESRVEAVYPADAVALDARGTVLVLATIRKTGEVSEVQVVSGPERFRDAASNAVRQWRYHPYEVDGEAVDVQTTMTLNFAPPN
jgi:TonB family protein